MLETDPRVPVPVLREFGVRFLRALGCTGACAAEIADHLVDADLCGVYSHGSLRLAQYAEQLRDGLYVAAGEPRLTRAEGGAAMVDGGNGLGMPAMRLATDLAIEAARRAGSSAVGVANVAHTGRLGALAERAAARRLIRTRTTTAARCCRWRDRRAMAWR